MHLEIDMEHCRANRQCFFTYKRSMCEESFLTCCSQPPVDVQEVFLHSLKLDDNRFYSCVTMTKFDFTLHKPSSCLTIQQIRQSIAFFKDCSRCPSLPTRTMHLRSVSWLSPSLCLLHAHEGAATSHHSRLHFEGNGVLQGSARANYRRHILDSTAVTPTWPLPS